MKNFALLTGLSLAGVLSSSVFVPLQAATLEYSVDAEFSDGGTLTGGFFYDGAANPANQYTNISLAATSGSQTPLLPNFTYDSNTSSIVSSSSTRLTLQAGSRVLDLQFVSALNPNDPNDSVAIRPSDSSSFPLPYINPSNEYASSSGATNLRGITSGDATAVPEPITLLGSGVALAFGAAFERRRKKA